MNRLTKLSVRNFYRKPFRLNLNRAIISFTFDDIPISAYENGASLLESCGATGTFYIAADLFEKEGPSGVHVNRNQVASLKKRRHHIGAHTYSHVRVDSLDRKKIDFEVERNRDALQEIIEHEKCTHFSYPFGELSVSSKKQLRQHYKTMRGIHPALNNGEIDLHLLDAVALYEHKYSKNKIDNWINDAIDSSGWLIFYTHDVRENPSEWGISIDSFKYALEKSVASGAAILNIEEAYDLITTKKAN